MTPFVWAAANWRRWAERNADEARHTCGSAERLYVTAGPRVVAVVVPINVREAMRFSALVDKLPGDERHAWLHRNGLCETERTEPWINEHYQLARTRLAAWFLKRSR